MTRPEHDALVAAMPSWPSAGGGPPLPALVGRCRERDLVDLALSEGLAGVAAERLAPLLSPASRSRLMTQVRLEATRNLAYLNLLGRLGEVLDGAGVRWAALKGPVLAEGAYAGRARAYTDLDLLVAPHQLGTAVRVLAAAGVPLAELDWPRLTDDLKGQVSLAVAGSPLVDLHWHLVGPRPARERLRIPTDALLERRQTIRLRGVTAWTLDPTDFALHVALHASTWGAERLRRLLDIERTLSHRPPDWDLLVSRCRAWRTELPVGVMLESARRTVNAPVPVGVVNDLAGGRLGRLAVRQVATWVPAGRLPGGRSIRRGLSRCLQDGWRATGAEFAAEAWGICGPGRRRPGRSRPVASSHADGFEGYLARVGRTDRYGHLNGGERGRRAVGA